MNRGNQAGQTAISHIPALLWLTLPPPAWGTRQIHYTSFVLLCLSLLSPCHNLVMRKQCWPVEGTCDRRGTATPLPPFSGRNKVPTSFLYKLSHWPMRGCMGWAPSCLGERQDIYSSQISAPTLVTEQVGTPGVERGADSILWNCSQLDCVQEVDRGCNRSLPPCSCCWPLKC